MHIYLDEWQPDQFVVIGNKRVNVNCSEGVMWITVNRLVPCYPLKVRNIANRFKCCHFELSARETHSRTKL